jgi:hypothetical protein
MMPSYEDRPCHTKAFHRFQEKPESLGMKAGLAILYPLLLEIGKWKLEAANINTGRLPKKNRIGKCFVRVA